MIELLQNLRQVGDRIEQEMNVNNVPFIPPDGWPVYGNQVIPNSVTYNQYMRYMGNTTRNYYLGQNILLNLKNVVKHYDQVVLQWVRYFVVTTYQTLEKTEEEWMEMSQELKALRDENESLKLHNSVMDEKFQQIQEATMNFNTEHTIFKEKEKDYMNAMLSLTRIRQSQEPVETPMEVTEDKEVDLMVEDSEKEIDKNTKGSVPKDW